MTMVTGAKLAQFAELLAEGKLRVARVETLPLDQAAEALARVATKHVRGKLVLTN